MPLCVLRDGDRPARRERAATIVARTIGRPAGTPGPQSPPESPYSNREVSPAPCRTISASPSEKSMTVVGTVPHSPESSTPSTT